jgi:hypothetical protein
VQRVSVQLQHLQTVDVAQTRGKLLDLVLRDGQNFEGGQIGDSERDALDAIPANVENLQRSHLQYLVYISPVSNWEGGRRTHGFRDLAHVIIAHIEVAEALAFNQTVRQSGEVVVGEGQALNLKADDVDDLVGQAGNPLAAQVDRDAGLLQLLVGRGVGLGAMAYVLAGLHKGGFGEGDDLVVGDGGVHVVAHGGGGGGGGRRWSHHRIVVVAGRLWSGGVGVGVGVDERLPR